MMFTEFVMEHCLDMRDSYVVEGNEDGATVVMLVAERLLRAYNVEELRCLKCGVTA